MPLFSWSGLCSLELLQMFTDAVHIISYIALPVFVSSLDIKIVKSNWHLNIALWKWRIHLCGITGLSKAHLAMLNYALLMHIILRLQNVSDGCQMCSSFFHCPVCQVTNTDIAVLSHDQFPNLLKVLFLKLNKMFGCHC